MPFGDRFDIRAALDENARDRYFARKEGRAPRERGAGSFDEGSEQAEQAQRGAAEPSSRPRARSEGYRDSAGRGKPSAQSLGAAGEKLRIKAEGLMVRARKFDPRLPLYIGVAAGIILLLVLILALSSCLAPKPVPVEAYDPAATPSALVPFAQRNADGALSLGEDNKLVVVLDPGHGGEDPGVILDPAYEDDIDWRIAQYCANYLRQYEGVEVHFTRTKVEGPTLEERAQTAEFYGADILVSLHINWNDDPTQQGVYTYYPNERSLWMLQETAVPGKAVAIAAHDRLVGLGLLGNGAWEYVLDANADPDVWRLTYPEDGTGITDYLGIIRNARLLGIPAVLIEHAFLSNPAEFALLTVDSFLKAAGEADAKAVLACYGFPIVE